MAKQILHRLMLVVPLMIGVYTVVFILIRVVPGDPVMALIENGVVSPNTIASLRHEYGLDQPTYIQYLECLSRLIRLDLGTSFQTGQPVIDMVRDALPYSVQLTLTAMALAAIIGLVTGLISAVRHNSWLDTSSMFLSSLGIAVPDFWLGLMLILLFVMALGWFPLTEIDLGWKVLALPAITLAVRPMASIARLSRASFLEVLSEAYVLTARSKGLSEYRVLIRHVFRNAMIPVLTIMGIDLAATLSNAMVIEVVFSRPGLGRLVLTAILHKDFPVIQSLVMLIAITYVLTNLVVDLSYTLLDPRIRTGV